MIRLSALFFMIALLSALLVGCGSGNDDASDGNLSYSFDDAPSATNSSGEIDGSSTVRSKPTKEELLERDIRDVISLLERGETDLVVIDYTDQYTLSQIKVHNSTFPERQSLQKLYDGFREGIAADLLADLKVCQSLEPEILEQDGGWYSAYFYDEDVMTAEVILGFDPQFDKNWELIELPLTLPWGTGGRDSSVWDDWRDAITEEGHTAVRPKYMASFDAHLNPAAVVSACRFAFKGREHDPAFLRRQSDDPDLQAEAFRKYMNLLTPDARRYEAAIIIRKLYTRKSPPDQYRGQLIELLNRYEFDREAMGGITVFPPYNNTDFYTALAEHFPKNADLSAFAGDAAKLYYAVEKKPYAMRYVFSAAPKQAEMELSESVAEFPVNWSDTFEWGNYKIPTRFYRIDGKWYVESYWQAYVRENPAASNE